ncbi:MAG TPA: FAD-binding oxidoreductase [Steroidobacteraceae bacterium]|nr:FAD-binding oxidoreductase [Steroidobacteraceae bacterium]
MSTTAADRRRFLTHSLAAAAAGIWLPRGRLWADAAETALPSQLAAVTLSGTTISLSASDVKDFRGSLRGQLLLREDAGYDQARRLWNGAFDRHPALIARCAGAADVVQAVTFARSHRLLTAIHSGGHSISGQSSCDGGLMIDLSPMKGLRIDPENLTATAQAGVLLGELDRESQAFGLATTLGTAADTGIAGLTLGGGQGRLARKFGLTCDNLLSVDIVTADGKLLHASEKENADLFWGLRGGGGNFGVVTLFEYRLHPLAPRVLAGNRVYPASRARGILQALREFCETAPDEMTISAALTPHAPGVDPGRYLAFEVVYCGAPNEGERLLAPLSKLGKPLYDDVVAKTYVAAQLGLTGASPAPLPPGLNVYVKSGFLRSLTDQVIDGVIEQFSAAPVWVEELGIGQLGGAMARVEPEATAYWNRAAQYDILLEGVWTDRSQDHQNLETGRALWGKLEPFTEGYYVNTEPSADERRLRATYGNNYPRLVKLKNRYDPLNLFRLNANIKPTVAT